MALDLSTVSEAQLDDGDQLNPSNCVLLYSEAITIPGTNDILFQVSPSGKLILANFSLEWRNGSHFLRKHGSDVSACSSSPEHPTNLSVEKNAGAPLSNELNSPTLRPITCESEPLISTATMGFADSVPQNLSTWNASQVTDLDHAEVEDLSVTEKPVDVSLPRTQTVATKDSTPTEDTLTHSDDEHKSVLTQLVKTILKERQIKDKSFGSDMIVSGNNLSELQRFVKRLKAYRQSVGMSQNQLSYELARHYGQQTMFSQSLLSRFEMLSVTVRAAFRLLPYIKNWLDHVEQFKSDPTTTTTKSDSPLTQVRALGKSRLATLVRLGYPPGYSNGTNNVSRCCGGGGDTSLSTTESDDVRSTSHVVDQDMIPDSLEAKSGSDSTNHTARSTECCLTDPDTRLTRRERTHFAMATRAILAAAYEKNPRPRGQELTKLAMETGHNRESIRIWFCNRRQLTHQTKSRKNKTT